MRKGNRSYPASPGELMDQANILARGLLYAAPEVNDRTMPRPWGEVVEAVGEVWQQVPARSDLVGGTGSGVSALCQFCASFSGTTSIDMTSLVP